MPQSRSRKHKASNENAGKFKLAPLGSLGVDVSYQHLVAAARRRHEFFEAGLGTAIAAMPAECRRDAITGPEESQVLLQSARMAIEKVGLKYARAMGSYAWLFWLRRVDVDLVHGQLPATAPYRMALAEALSAMTPKTDNYPATDYSMVFPPLSATAAESMLKLLGAASLLQMIHAMIRRAGKGQSIRWSSDDEPCSVPNSAIDEPISLYDSRVASGQPLVPGTAVSQFHSITESFDIRASLPERLLAVASVGAAIAVPQWQGQLTAGQFNVGEGRFLTGSLSLSGLEQLLQLAKSTSPWAQPGLASLIILLRALFKVAYVSSDMNLGVALPTVGYFVVPRKSLVEWLATST